MTPSQCLDSLASFHTQFEVLAYHSQDVCLTADTGSDGSSGMAAAGRHNVRCSGSQSCPGTGSREKIQQQQRCVSM